MLVLAITLGGGLAWLAAWSRYSERLYRDWHALLDPEELQALESIRGQMKADLGMVAVVYQSAELERRLGTADEAIRLLRIGSETIERLAPDLQRRLACLAVVSRMVSTIVPLRPLRPRQFNLPRLSGLAALNQVTHRFLVAAHERFRFKLHVLAAGVRLVVGTITRKTADVERRRSVAYEDWHRIDLAREDFRTLADETLQCYRTLLVSMAEERRLRALA